MKVTPLDLRQAQLKTSIRGYDRAEVTASLADAAGAYEHALQDQEQLRHELARVEVILAEHRGQERHLHNTLLTAQRTADEVRERAHQDAARMVREAESRVDRLLRQAQAQLEDIQREIDGLRSKRHEVESSLEGLITTLGETLEFVREQDARHRDDNILLHRPRPSDTPTQLRPATAVVPDQPDAAIRGGD